MSTTNPIIAALQSTAQHALTWVVSEWSKIPTGTLTSIFDAAPAEIAALESDTTLTGWQKLEKVVTDLTAKVPNLQQYEGTVSTALTIIVAAARLYVKYAK